MATETVILDCARLHSSGLAAIDRIARSRLEARRCGCELALRNPSRELLELICFLGLDRCLGVEVKRQPEQREQPGRVEEKGELADPPTFEVQHLQRPG